MASETRQAPVVLTVAEAADIMRCSQESVYRLIAAGRLDAFTVGSRGKRITMAALERYMTGVAA